MNKEDRVIKHLLKFESRVDKKFDLIEKKRKQDKDEIMSVLDSHTKMLNKLDQERVFTRKWIERLKDDVKGNIREIKRVKKVLEIA
jgi:flagellar basal body-associated protein FliL